jgi:hypothetical protein
MPNHSIAIQKLTVSQMVKKLSVSCDSTLVCSWEILMAINSCLPICDAV